MSQLTIYVDAFILTAIEKEYGENIRYVESFNNWAELFNTLGKYMGEYASVDVRIDNRQKWVE